MAHLHFIICPLSRCYYPSPNAAVAQKAFEETCHHDYYRDDKAPQEKISRRNSFRSGWVRAAAYDYALAELFAGPLLYYGTYVPHFIFTEDYLFRNFYSRWRASMMMRAARLGEVKRSWRRRATGRAAGSDYWRWCASGLFHATGLPVFRRLRPIFPEGFSRLDASLTDMLTRS